MRAGLYGRISEDDQDTGQGVEGQERDVRALVRSAGGKVVRTYIDNDLSASTFSRAKRPAFEQMIKDAEAGIIDTIAATTLDRLSRRLSELDWLVRWSNERGITLLTTEGDDTRTAAGRMIIGVKGAVAQHEAEKISERVIRQKRTRREMGDPQFGGSRSFGWQDPQRQILHPEEAKAIRDGCAMILDGMSINAVMREWTARGVKPVKSEHWGRSVVGRALTAPRNAGLLTHKGEVIGPANTTPIVDEATWRAVCATVKDRHKPGRGGARVHALAGLVQCGACGNPMLARVYREGPPSRSRWACVSDRGGCGRNSISYHAVDDLVFAMARKVIEQAPSRAPKPAADATLPARREISRLEGLLAATRAKIADGTLDQEDGFALMADTRSVITDLKRTIEPRKTLEVPAKSRALEILADMSPESVGLRQSLLKQIVGRVVIEPSSREERLPTLQRVRVQPAQAVE